MPEQPDPHICNEKRGAIVGSTSDTARCGCPGGTDIDDEPRCYWVAGHELCPSVEQAHARGIAEGLRQSTDGLRREWGAWWNAEVGESAIHDDDVFACETEALARRTVDRSEGARSLVSRLVGPWEPAEQPEGGA